VVKTVLFHGRTDVTDHIVEEKPFQADQECARGNLLLCRHPANGHGLFFLQEAPPSNERRDFEQYDFRIKDGSIYSCCWGIHPGEFVSGKEYGSYRHVLGIFHNDVERTVLLKNYLKRRFPFDVSKNATVMVNPWGCGHFRELASEDFIKKDMAAGAEVAASHYQIDDGWQSGGGLAELSVKNRKITRDFWKISEKFTDRSFDHVTAHGRAHGIEPALWLAPSCNCDYEDWEEFADLILEFYHKYSIRFFKIDSVLLRTYRSEQNLRALLTKVRRETHGDVLFDLDTTNGQRCGYFHFLEFGNIFLENRYTMGGLGYHPEKVLHTLWMMSRYVNPFMLQIEIPDPDEANTEFYETHPHGDFRCYPMDYMAMLTMFASPLLWCTPSTLSAVNRKIIREVMLLHKQHRQKIASGIVFSVGREPDTHVITGLQSHDFEDGSGYLLFFREKNCFMESDILPLSNIPQNARWEILAGEGSVAPAACKGTYEVAVLKRCGYLFLKYSS
ncbi:MAG: hypothetical protein J6S58_06970, partial [Lentisphaeria bacterium]|nr:hypothetical protein [Lentisphaeria bacterium]